MFGVAGRRIAEAVVALFAALGFALVPLGQKTALEHTISIFTTPAARGALQGLLDAAEKLRSRFTAGLSADPSRGQDTPRPELPELERAPERPRAE